MTTLTTMAVLRVFDVPDEDGMRRYWDTHATNGALELEPGHYELVVRQQEECPDCEGHGVEGEEIPSGDPFQPPDVQGCPTCGRVKARTRGVTPSDAPKWNGWSEVGDSPESTAPDGVVGSEHQVKE